MKEVIPATKRLLPSLDSLYSDPIEASKHNDLNKILNAEPKDTWIREHPFAKNVKYIPISVLEYLMTSIFTRWHLEVKDTKVIANAVVCTVRLNYMNPISNEWDFQDGVGAAPIQTAKGAAATDFTQVLTDAVVKAAPSAKSYAFKDACESIGRLFGKDLNRKEYLPYTNLDGKLDKNLINCSLEQIGELHTLRFSASLTPEENDEYAERIGKGITVAEYEMIKWDLTEKQVSVLDRIRRGENLSQKEIGQAVSKKMDDSE